jgi:hypothetical protein
LKNLTGVMKGRWLLFKRGFPTFWIRKNSLRFVSEFSDPQCLEMWTDPQCLEMWTDPQYLEMWTDPQYLEMWTDPQYLEMWTVWKCFRLEMWTVWKCFRIWAEMRLVFIVHDYCHKFP